jgi:hypothetical protein
MSNQEFINLLMDTVKDKRAALQLFEISADGRGRISVENIAKLTEMAFPELKATDILAAAKNTQKDGTN